MNKEKEYRLFVEVNKGYRATKSVAVATLEYESKAGAEFAYAALSKKPDYEVTRLYNPHGAYGNPYDDGKRSA